MSSEGSRASRLTHVREEIDVIHLFSDIRILNRNMKSEYVIFGRSAPQKGQIIVGREAKMANSYILITFIQWFLRRPPPNIDVFYILRYKSSFYDYWLMCYEFG